MKSSYDFACEKCFNDDRLIELIRKGDKRSNCLWCGSRRVRIIPLYELGELFRDVAQIYEELNGPDAYEQGEYIDFLLQEDWEIFSEKIVEAPNEPLHEMTVAILKAGLEPKEIYELPAYDRGFFQRSEPWLEDNWHERIEALFSGSTTESKFPSPEEPDVLEAAFEDLASHYSQGQLFFRARIHKDRPKKERFSNADLSAPPPEKTPAARANRKGKPVLYLSSDERTALAEVRSWKGAAVAVAEMKLQRDVRIIDLLQYKAPKSPFFEEYLEWKLQLSGLFYRFADELSRPVIPKEEDTLYLPSQHLCELVEKAGYEGIAYPSAMGPGSNIVLFNPNDAMPISVKYLRIKGIEYDVRDLKELEDIYEELPYVYLAE